VIDDDSVARNADATRQVTMPDSASRPTVFISYAHADEAWKDRLVKHLRVLADERGFAVWDDRQIGAGDDWRARIADAMASVRVAILLVSADFLGSRFIRDEEVPPLLARRQGEGLPVVPVILRPCTWQQIAWLSALQALPVNGRPLSAGNDHQIDDDLARIATEIDELLRGGSAAPAEAARASVAPVATEQGARGRRRGGLPRSSLRVGDVTGSVVVQGSGNTVVTGAARPRPKKRAAERPSAGAARATSSARQRYLDWVAERYRFLDFKGMGVNDRVPLRLELAEMYVPLAARVELPRDETWGPDVRLAGRVLTEDEREAMGRGLSRPVPVEELLKKHDGLIVLGDPGAGKTTLLKYLALRLAQGCGAELGLGDRLPVLVPFSAYAGVLAAKDVPLLDFIADYFPARAIDLPVADLLREALRAGRALVLLDGLDEVRDAGQRHLAIERVVEFFRFHRPAGNKFVVTSRIVGYRDVRPTADGLGECTLVDFEQAEIEAFVGKWTVALERAAHGDTSVAAGEARRERDELLASVQHNPGVRALAANPLLLTILALMKRQGIALPERRVELYQNYVETLLKHWNRARGLDRPPSRDLDVVETLRVLAPLALAMHEQSPGVGLVRREDVRAKLEEIYVARGVPDPEVAARRLLEDLRTHAGLLLERGPGQYGFIHLTFQEYLAAIALAQQAQRDVGVMVAALSRHVGDATWREVSLLAIGYVGLVQGYDEAASEVVERLLRDRPGEPGQAATLCGEAVADAWPGGVTRACRESAQVVLLATMRDGGVPAPQRAAAGDALGRVGDPRFRGRDEWCLPVDPLLGFVETRAGEFVMGEGKETHRVVLPRYFIARYPVTVAQFRAFVEDGGQVADPDSIREPATRPVRWVQWSEALAYADWLTARLRAWDGTPEPLASLLREADVGKRWRVTLPSEAEWERAARGAGGRSYPWGEEPPTAARANYREVGIRRPSAVGCFPGGATPDGVEELSGNVWEWTRSVWTDYPYDPADGREDLNVLADKHRAVRGGSFGYGAVHLRAAVRLRLWYADHGFGFRVVVSPFDSGL
jgi:formylglycine-generating enzyme required for sulfatase activity